MLVAVGGRQCFVGRRLRFIPGVKGVSDADCKDAIRVAIKGVEYTVPGGFDGRLGGKGAALDRVVKDLRRCCAALNLRAGWVWLRGIDDADDDRFDSGFEARKAS